MVCMVLVRIFYEVFRLVFRCLGFMVSLFRFLVSEFRVIWVWLKVVLIVCSMVELVRLCC